MKRIDRFLAIEFILFVLLGLVTVVVIYDLINLIERMSYFLRYKAKALEILLYYVYDLPAAIELLLPVGFALGVFMVIGRLIRANELLPLLAAGVNIYRLFAVFIAVSLIVAALAFVGSEFISPRVRTRFVDYKTETIEHRKQHQKTKSRIFYISESGRVYYLRQLRIQDSLALDLVIWELDPQRKIQRSIRAKSATYSSSEGWRAEDVEIHDFSGEETGFRRYPERRLAEITETPEELAVRTKGTDEMKLSELEDYIQRMSAAGSNVAVELVEYNMRFSAPLIIVIVTLISLSAATLLRKGNITLGIGLGLLLSFLYWGAIQASRAFGYAGAFPPWLAAWLPNILFSGVSAVLLTKVKS